MIKYKTLILGILIISLGSCRLSKNTTTALRTATNNNGLDDSTIVFQRQLMKDYALCRCITNAYKVVNLGNEDISISFYHEQSLYSYIAEKKIDSLSNEVANGIPISKYLDYKGKKPIIYLCTEFYKSAKLDSLINSFDYLIMK